MVQNVTRPWKGKIPGVVKSLSTLDMAHHNVPLGTSYELSLVLQCLAMYVLCQPAWLGVLSYLILSCPEFISL